MSLMAWGASICGGALGAILWGSIAQYTGLDVGYISWGIGLLVGYLAKSCGGRGKLQGFACALVTTLSILGGKGLATNAKLQQRVQSELPVFYQERVRDAQAYRPQASDAEIAQFMIDHAFSEREVASAVSPEEIGDFRKHSGPVLERFAKSMPEFTEWLESSEVQELKQATSDLKTVASWTKKSMGILDWIFGGLGVASAYQVVANPLGDDGSEDDEDEDEEDEGPDGDPDPGADD